MRKNIGSSLTDFLDDQGIREEVDLLSKKKMLAQKLSQCMLNQKVTRTRLAKRMETSRTQVNRLLDPEDTSLTLATLAKAAGSLGLDMVVDVEERRKVSKRRSKR
jgi:antitoxin HicB